MKFTSVVFTVAFLSLAFCPLMAQETETMSDEERAAASKAYSDRYDLLVSKLGLDGVGIETVLDNWAGVDPDNRKLLTARYSYYLTKAQNANIVVKPGKKYLGQTPLFTLRDSLGNDVNYFQSMEYDDSLFSIALTNIDKLIRLNPYDLELKFMKSAALISYEGESPDMALANLKDLVDQYYAAPTAPWVYQGESLESGFLVDAIQEYCYTFFDMGTPSSYLAFKSLSEKMLTKEPDETIFISNIGSYYLVAVNDQKQALKQYNKVLKVKPDDYTALKNCVLIYRRQKNTKMEAKYLPGLISVTPDEREKAAAEARLRALQ